MTPPPDRPPAIPLTLPSYDLLLTHDGLLADCISLMHF